MLIEAQDKEGRILEGEEESCMKMDKKFSLLPQSEEDEASCYLCDYSDRNRERRPLFRFIRASVKGAKEPPLQRCRASDNHC